MCCFDAIPFTNADILLEHKVILIHLESLKKELVFHDLSYALKHKQDSLVSFNTQNINYNF